MKLSALVFTAYLAATATATKYIYYGALAPHSRCSRAGAGCAAWICDHPDPANKYSRGCEAAARCRTDAIANCPSEFMER
ncbi:hypothetical protein FOMA001_g17864 [Fusarium oxysporum f. sp. matthiolae]|nr:hypothetical protein FOMA001_g17864 [Fusarium oxysporum f. sp. matthiolae]